jgi:predicted nucleic acid-binding protein
VNVLVDTNVVSELKLGVRASPRVLAWFAALPPERVYTSVIVLGELRRGIELIERRDRTQAKVLERWYSSMRQRLGPRVLDVDESVMMAWARISTPDMLPAYDGLIAATALVHGMVVATRNSADFRRTGVEVFDPWKDRA